jgi:hypothetical protein
LYDKVAQGATLAFTGADLLAAHPGCCLLVTLESVRDPERQLVCASNLGA